MQKTKIYQFNLIEGGDAFSQEPINENTKAVEAILSQLPRIQSGSYVGTGVWGKDNPNTLTFDFVPKVVLFDMGHGNNYFAFPYLWGSVCLPVQYCYNSTSTLYENNQVTLNGSTMTWYAEGFSAHGDVVQLNDRAVNYRWVAIG